MSRYAVLDATGDVVQIVEWDGVTEWTPGEGHTLRELADNEHPEIVPPVDQGTPPPPNPDPDRAVARMNALLDVLAENGKITPEDVQAIEMLGDSGRSTGGR